MREFILRASKAKTSPDINLNDLPGEGYIDTVCRCISNAFFVSNHMRDDVIFHVVMDGPPSPPKVITLDKLEELKFDERNIAKRLANALKKGKDLQSGEEAEVEAGVKVSKKSFEKLLKEKAEGRKVFYLHKKGKDIRQVDFGDDPLFVLGDHSGLPKKTEGLLDRLGARKIKLGPVMLFASHCIVVVNNELDRKEFGK